MTDLRLPTDPRAATPDGGASSPVVTVEGVGKRFGDVTAVDGVDLDVHPCELLALVGPSGCGKSTLLRLVAGLQRADHGTVRIGGRLVDGPHAWVPTEHRNIGVAFQDHALFPHLSVADNIAFGLVERDRRRGGARRHAEARGARLAEVLDLVDLTGFAQRYPHELSGGEQQRVALARALAPDPDVVLLDEPFSDLDRSLRDRVRAETVEVLRAAGTAAVLVTHDQQEALAVGDRLAVMRAGRVEQLAVPATAYHAPRNRFVATFMGDADFLPGVVGPDGRVDTEVGGVPAAAGLPADDAVDVMVRPHEVTFAVDGAGDAVVTDVEFQGAFVRYTLALSSGRRLRALRPHTVEARAGTRVRVRLDPGHAPTVFRGDEAVAGPVTRPGSPGAGRQPA